MQSEGDFFSSKIEKSSVVINDAYHQIRNAPCDDRQVNDLCRCFRYLIFWCHVQRKFMYRMYALEVTLLYADNERYREIFIHIIIIIGDATLFIIMNRVLRTWNCMFQKFIYGIRTIPRESLFPHRFRQNKIYYSKHSHSMSCCKSQSSLDRARNHHHLNLWLESRLWRERCSSRLA